MRITERSIYPPILEFLSSLGYAGVSESEIEGTYPDIVFWSNSEKFILQVKIGGWRTLLKGVADVSRHARHAKSDNIVVLLYPPEIRRTMTPTTDLPRLVLDMKVETLVATQYWCDSPETTVRELLSELKRKVEAKRREPPSMKLVLRTFRNSIETLSEILRSFAPRALDAARGQVVGRFDLFLALGRVGDTQERELELASIDLISYLLANQILFYHMYSATTNLVPPLDTSSDILGMLSNRFKQIQDINYEAIYSINVLPYIPRSDAIESTLRDLIDAIVLIRPQDIKQDLIGRLFHELLPFKTRKTLAAFYTKPMAAEILSSLVIDKWDETVIDPASGSGTILVAAYHRKNDLARELTSPPDSKHKMFVQDQLTAIDIMPFAAHLTAVNLSSQSLRETTDRLRVAIQDSLDLSGKTNAVGGVKIRPFSILIQKRVDRYAKAQRQLSDYPLSKDHVQAQGAVGPEGGKGEEFFVKRLDCVLMNPPFSDREKMPPDYRGKLKDKSKVGLLLEKCGGQVNLWGYFLALADELLREGGKLGAVIPFNVLRGGATQKIRDFLLDNYRIRYIVRSTVENGFSEGASFRDLLFVAERIPAGNADPLAVVFLHESLDSISYDGIKTLSRKIREIQPFEEYRDQNITVTWMRHDELKQTRTNLMWLVSVSDPDSRQAIDGFLSVVHNKSGDKLTKLKREDIREGFHASPAGLSQVCFVTRPLKRDRVSRAFLILNSENQRNIKAVVQETGTKISVPLKSTTPALRTVTNVNRIDVEGIHDFMITQPYKGMETVIQLSKWKRKEIDWEKLRAQAEGSCGYLFTARRFRPNSANTHAFAFTMDRMFVAPDTFKRIQTSGPEEARIQCLILNSILGLTSLLRFREETTEDYTDVRMGDLILFDVFQMSSLTGKERSHLSRLFERLRENDLPPLLEQLDMGCDFRRELDSTILRILGLSDQEIEHWLPKVYRIVRTELRTFRKMQ